MYQRYGGDHVGIPDLKEHQEVHGPDETGVGFPLLPVFFPVTRKKSIGGLDLELFPMS